MIQLDIDATELGRNYPNAVSLHGDVKATLTRLLELAPESAGHESWLATTAGYVAEFRRDAGGEVHLRRQPDPAGAAVPGADRAPAR